MYQGNIIQVKNIFKDFTVGGQVLPVLKDITLDVKSGEFIVIIGPSGCGKSTLLHSLLGLEEPTKGEVYYKGLNIYIKENRDAVPQIRKNDLGIIYQQPNWIKSLNVLENIAFPLLLLGYERKFAMAQASELLEMIEMTYWANHNPNELSSGQQQRIALCRAIIINPEMVIADEPTGNLDFASGQQLMQLLADLCTERKKTIIMVTHDMVYIKYATKIVRMLDGKITGLYGKDDVAALYEELNKETQNFYNNAGLVNYDKRHINEV